MRIQIITAGTMGSVAPYTGLGHRLVAEGHEVEIVTHAKFEELVTCCGLRMRPLPADPFEELIGAHTRFRHGGRSLRAVQRLAHATERAAAGLVDGIITAVDPSADLVMLSTIAAPVGRVVARYHDIPSMGVFLQPDTPTAAFSPCAMSWREPGYANRLRGRAVNVAMDALYAAACRRLHARLGLPYRSGHRLRRAREASRWPIWHGYSPSVVPRPSDWRPELRVAGYWWPHECPLWTPPALVTDFLAAGPPPVLVSLGSMMPDAPERLSAITARALRHAGLRGIVQSGWAGLSVVNDDVITVGSVPHGWLMPRMAGVVHHAGAGTTGAGLRAGVPAVPMPVLTDQPWWAARLVQLGVSPRVLPHRELTASRLADAMRRATGEPRFTERATAFAKRLAQEDGAGAVARAAAELAS
ncbi:glycosyltransferase [Streptomyces netropsis]|uniref:UDP:flavonoid glycosyltransferase YjiC (YdhE family) n=1 Tax=Streptomyces netropsis TaxID=55404 RepID=A0A7W7LCR0_STRNE|nr:glycosyltransferase [Streptomyces netropsis]MBB4887276.1 UDP:flavonoid glycosyltransferase YjiC (YdhE family) [Streptomyces netropsis]GGR09151.1 glycosyl transferase [Streptomyces netropsis]